MIKIAAITQGKNSPAARFRIRQCIPYLYSQEIHAREFYPPIPKNKKIRIGNLRQRYLFPVSSLFFATKVLSDIPFLLKTNAFDATWLNREILPRINLEKYLKQPLFFDVDDSIWISDREHIKKIALHSKVIIAGNQYIADWFSQYNPNVEVVPTSIDLARFISKQNTDTTFVIGWTGSSDNLKYLYGIEDALGEFLDNHPDSYLKVICDTLPAFQKIKREKLIYRKWSPGTEVSELEDISAGIMPLEDNEWTRGKCSFKMLQYMAMEKPVVVSPVGMNREVTDDGEAGFFAGNPGQWYESLEYLYKHREKAQNMGQTGLDIVRKKYSTEVVSFKLAEIFKKNL